MLPFYVTKCYQKFGLYFFNYSNINVGYVSTFCKWLQVLDSEENKFWEFLNRKCQFREVKRHCLNILCRIMTIMGLFRPEGSEKFKFPLI